MHKYKIGQHIQSINKELYEIVRLMPGINDEGNPILDAEAKVISPSGGRYHSFGDIILVSFLEDNRMWKIIKDTQTARKLPKWF